MTEQNYKRILIASTCRLYKIQVKFAISDLYAITRLSEILVCFEILSYNLHNNYEATNIKCWRRNNIYFIIVLSMQSIPVNFEIIIDNKLVKWVSSTKYLGVLVEHHLKGDIGMISNVIYVLSALSRLVTYESLRMTYIVALQSMV